MMTGCRNARNQWNGTLSLDTVTSTYVKGTVTANEDGILYTSIPYYRGFGVC